MRGGLVIINNQAPTLCRGQTGGSLPQFELQTARDDGAARGIDRGSGVARGIEHEELCGLVIAEQCSTMAPEQRRGSLDKQGEQTLEVQLPIDLAVDLHNRLESLVLLLLACQEMGLLKS